MQKRQCQIVSGPSEEELKKSCFGRRPVRFEIEGALGGTLAVEVLIQSLSWNDGLGFYWLSFAGPVHKITSRPSSSPFLQTISLFENASQFTACFNVDTGHGSMHLF